MNEQIKPQIERKNLGNLDVYKDADLIVETTKFCNKKCEGCYNCSLTNLCNKEIKIDEKIKNSYSNEISKLKEGDVVALRGGEPTLIENWFEEFIVPALGKKLKVILETNGFFIERQQYQKILQNIKKDNLSIFIRISLDEKHLSNITLETRNEELKKMTHFAEDAEKDGINFGFYSMGTSKNQMNEEKIKSFVKETSLEQFINKFHSLVFYPKISDVNIKGKYLKTNGEVSNKIEI
jgi:pyruvate-formate lyase-activating enzyme